MKKIIFPALVIILLSLIKATSAKAQNKNTLSVETGYFFGGPANKILNQMRVDGFGELIVYGPSNFFGLFSSNGGITYYPYAKKRGIKFWLRYERELKNNRGIELSFGMINKSTVFGHDSVTNGSRTSRNFLTYDNILHCFKANYLFYTPKRNLAIGVGPAIVYYKLQPPKYGPHLNHESKSYILGGVSVTGLWKFVNRKQWFMSIRTDDSFTTSAKIIPFKITPSGTAAEFKGTKAGSFVGSITAGVGIKF